MGERRPMTDRRERSYADIPRWLGPALAVLAPIVHFWPAAAGRLLLAPGDAVLYLVPVRRLAAEFVARGQWPLWNPFVFAGFPFLAVSQTAVLHPGTWMFLVLPALWAVNLQMIATYAIAALGTFAYARAIGASVAGATLAATTFSLSGFNVGHLGYTGLVQATALLPAALWGAERLRHKQSAGVVAGGAAAVGLGVLAGHPQGSLLVAGTVAAYAAYFAAATRPPAGRERYLAACAAMLVAGLLLGAVQLVPTAELVSHTRRSALGFEEFSSFALPPAQVPTLVFPFLFGGDTTTPYWGAWNFFELFGYTGLVPLIAALAAWPLVRHDVVARFWVALAFLSLALALGQATPLASLAYRVPVWNLFRAPARALLQFDLAVAVLAAIGASHALRSNPRWLRRAAVATGLFVAVAAVVAATLGPRLLGARAARAGLDAGVLAEALSWHGPAILWPVVVAAAAAAAWLVATRHRGCLALLVVLAVHVADVTLVGQLRLSRSFLRADQVDVVPDFVPWLRQHGVTAGRGRVLLLADGSAVRADLGRWDVAMVNGYDPYILARFSEVAGGMTYYGTVPDAALLARPGFLDLLNVTHLVSNAPQEAGPSGPFAQRPLDLALRPGEAVEFALPRPAHATHLDVVSSLFDGVRVEEGRAVARVSLIEPDGRATVLVLAAGRDTAEWAWDNPALRGTLRHRRGAIHESFAAGPFVGHRYRSTRALPLPLIVSRLRVESLSRVNVSRMSLVDRDTGLSYPCTREQALLADAGRWEFAARIGGATILRNRHALPRAWFVEAVRVLPAGELLEVVRTGRLQDGTPFHPGRVALVEEPVALPLAFDGDGEVRITRYEANRVELRSRTQGPAFLVLADTHYPGWRAEVDGVEAPILRVNGVLRGLALPAGRHVVRFTFRPRSLVAGAAVSAASAATLGAWVFATAWRRRRA
jgi:hypothetical protein